jgi:tRNA nucleotidyltransferase (CCA-adding enzyme)
VKQEVVEICRAVRDAGGRALLVGGWVRDFHAGIESKDYDIEVYGVAPERLRAILEGFGRVNTVGDVFAVYKLVFGAEKVQQRSEPVGRFEVDVSVPRRESKSGRGHRGFTVQGDPAMPVEEAARRRDFTVNAILYDPLTDETLDPFSGLSDLNRRILRAVAAGTFVEDSLRVLRAMQLAARFEMTIAPGTVELCRAIDLSDLPRERVWGEFDKLFTLAERPGRGLSAALELGILDKLFPEISALAGCKQDPECHPEGDVFEHTRLCLDAAAALTIGLPRPQRITVLLGSVCHDLGKPAAMLRAAGRIEFPDHDAKGIEPSRRVLDGLGLATLDGYDVRARVLELVREHLEPARLHSERDRPIDGALRRLSRRVNPRLLYLLAKADGRARGAASSDACAEWFIERVRALAVEDGPPEPILKGRHLLEAGVEPGPLMGQILNQVYERQLDGDITTLDKALSAALELRGGRH